MAVRVAADDDDEGRRYLAITITIHKLGREGVGRPVFGISADSIRAIGCCSHLSSSSFCSLLSLLSVAKARKTTEKEDKLGRNGDIGIRGRGIAKGRVTPQMSTYFFLLSAREVQTFHILLNLSPLHFYIFIHSLHTKTKQASAFPLVGSV